MNSLRRSKRKSRRDRGSALLVSLMVIVGLSLLGLGFVAISETETAIAKNQQNALQTQAIAESGAKLVVEWFQDPTWALAHAALPSNDVSVNANLAAIKTSRVIPGYTGVYKPSAINKLFDLPFRPAPSNRFYGSEDSPDLIINRTTDSTTIDNFNTVLLGADTSGGEVVEILVFAPPIVGGTLTSGFWVGGQRFGVATIKVTAQQFQNRTARTGIIASHAVRIVVGEVPLPIPGGPIQSNTSISFGGNFVVHWGNETSTGTLDNKRNPSSIPWANAYDRPHYEHGYEPGTAIAGLGISNGGAGYVAAPTVTIAAPPSGTTATATATLTGGVVTGLTITNRGTGYVNAPGTLSWGPAVTFSAPPVGGTLATGVAYVGAETWPITGAQFADANFLQEILGKTYEDPWFGSRSVGDNLANGTGPATPTAAQCYPYSYTATEDDAASASYFFQWQGVNLFPWQRTVLFPTIKYEFWKRITSQSRGYKGLYYFTSDGTSNYKKFNLGAAKTMVEWVNVHANGLGPGVYFFDSNDNATNPQTLSGAAKTAKLNDDEDWNSSSFNSSGGPPFLMQGFIYMNVKEYGTSGVGAHATTVDANFPGELFRDIGYPKWITASSTWDTSCAGQICKGGSGDAIFSYQDLNGNGRFDVVTMSTPAFNSYDSAATAHAAGSTWVPKTWKSTAQATADYGAACTVPLAAYNGSSPGANDCSEPHEPYLNFLYPAAATGSVTVGWEDPTAQTYDAKKTGVTCTSASLQTDCTSNHFDLDGPMVDLDVILNGVLYNEGDYRSTGNVHYYGSLLINGDVQGTGTPDIWFDESLIKGTWGPPGMPRVMVFSMQTDESSQ